MIVDGLSHDDRRRRAGTRRRSPIACSGSAPSWPRARASTNSSVDKLRERIARLSGRVAAIRVGCRHRDRADRAPPAHRGRGARHARGAVGGRDRRRRRRAAARARRDRRVRARARRGHRRGDHAPGARGAAAPDRAQRGHRAVDRGGAGRRGSARARGSTRRPASTATCSTRAIIDPVMVTRSALANAASIAKNVLTTECVVTEPGERGPRPRWRARSTTPRTRSCTARRGSCATAPRRALTLQAGVDRIADAIKVTLGPMGRNVLVTDTEGRLTITNDGATIAAGIDLGAGLRAHGRAAGAPGRDVDQRDRRATARRRRPCSPRRSSATGCATSPPARIRWRCGAGSSRRSSRSSRTCATCRRCRSTTREQVAHVATISAGDPEIGELIAEAIDARRQRRRALDPGRPDDGPRARGLRGRAARAAGCISRRHRDRRQRAARPCSTTRTSCSSTRRSTLGGSARAGHEPGRADRPPAARHRDDDRGRGAADAHPEQAARQADARARCSRPSSASGARGCSRTSR